MPRTVGWEDKSITGGRGGPDKERRFRGVKGTTFVVRVVTDCEEYRKHFVDDVLEPSKSGEARGFNMNCSKTWNDELEDYDGECIGCEREYETSTSYIAGILVLGFYKGRSTRVQRQDPENAVHYWDFGPDKYRQISDIVLDLQRSKKPKKLAQVELTVKCEDEHYQKLNIAIGTGDPIMDKENARDYLDCWKEEGPALIKAASEAPSIAEQKRRLKPKRKRDDDRGDGSEDEKRTNKRTPKRRSKKPDPEPDDDQDGGDEDLDSLLDDI